eukprot:TRINITY_DN112656_c0_g1_i1.p1 TRINITY_DN112656_c0_g1~~TRINITY_DN112656_c0_g1_i1.p1  ORF type:complete len:117 (+),score=14.89 TRINITY_DN112656_c0_g1_i1:191-541(+)
MRGPVTALAINVGNQTSRLHFEGLGDVVQAYILTASYDAAHSLSGKGGLLNTNVLLNGKSLQMESDGRVPKMMPASASTAHGVSVPGTAIAFFVLPEAAHASCTEGTASDLITVLL